MQLALLPEARIPERGGQCYELLLALINGERLTVKTAIDKHGVYALSQRMGELKRKYGWPIRSRTVQVGPKAYVSEYWMECDAQRK